MIDLGYDLERTMRGLEAGLRVEQIATFSVETCTPTDTLDQTCKRMADSGLDQLPVASDGRIVGVIELPIPDQTGHVADAMKPLQDVMLVSAGDSLGEILPMLAQNRYRLVVRGGRIAGIVTRSDLIKLPVRLFAFTKITHLELLMADLIQHCIPETNDWMGYLSENRRRKVLEKHCEAGGVGLDPSMLEFTDFCDKRDILRKHLKLGKPFESDLKEVERLRNTIAHAGDYGKSQESLTAFLNQLALVDKWIGKLMELRTGGAA